MKSVCSFALIAIITSALAASFSGGNARADDTSDCMAAERASIEQLKKNQHELLKSLNITRISSTVNQSHGADNAAIRDAKNKTRVTTNPKTGKGEFTVGFVVASNGSCLSYDADQMTRILSAELNQRQGMWATAKAGQTALAGMNNRSTYGSAIADSYNNPNYNPGAQSASAKRSGHGSGSAAN